MALLEAAGQLPAGSLEVASRGSQLWSQFVVDHGSEDEAKVQVASCDMTWMDS